MTSLSEIEGIGPASSAKLEAAGLKSVEDLLSVGATAKGRDGVAEKTGISSKLILEWVNHADLFRIKGVGSEYADLLEAAGVDSPAELAQRNAVNLHAKLVATNETKKLVRAVPTEPQVAGWIEHAKTLERVVQH